MYKCEGKKRGVEKGARGRICDGEGVKLYQTEMWRALRIRTAASRLYSFMCAFLHV